MSKKKNKHSRYTWKRLAVRNLVFRLFYIALVVALVLGIRVVYRYFDENLTEYEKNQYSYVAEDMASIFTEKRFDELCAYDKNFSHLSDKTDGTENPMTGVYLESSADFAEFMSKTTQNANIEYHRVASKDAGELRYLVTADRKAFAEFTLERKLDENGNPVSFGFEAIPVVGFTMGGDVYEKGNIEFSVLQPVTYDYTIPSGATLTVNGKELSDEYVVKTEELFYAGHLPEGYEAEKLVSYRFTCALPDTEIKVTDADGKAVKLTDMGLDTFCYEPAYDEGLREEFEPLAMNFAASWCEFSTQSTYDKVVALTVRNSAAHALINSYEKVWVTKADRAEVLDSKTFNFIRICDNAVSCEATCTYHTVTVGKENEYPLHMRMYFTNTDKGWKVYDFELLKTTEEQMEE